MKDRLPDHQSENRPKTGRKTPRKPSLLGPSGNLDARPKKAEEESVPVKARQDKANSWPHGVTFRGMPHGDELAEEYVSLVKKLLEEP